MLHNTRPKHAINALRPNTVRHALRLALPLLLTGTTLPLLPSGAAHGQQTTSPLYTPDPKTEAARAAADARAAKAARALRLKQPRLLRVRVGGLGEENRLFLSDFATEEQLPTLSLLREGKREEAAKLFKTLLPTDTTGVAAVGLAQATSPAEWPTQIKELDGQFNRKQGDVRLGFRLGLLLYYDAIAAGMQFIDYAEFDEAYKQFTYLWQHTQDPFCGLMLSEMAGTSHKGWKNPDAIALLTKLVGVVGGKPALAAFQQAKSTHYASVPPAVDVVPLARRHALAGVLCGLWSHAVSVSSHAVINGSAPVWVPTPRDPDMDRQAMYLDRWIQTLNPRLGKKIAQTAPNAPKP
jgi:hypothetical protein